MTPTTVVRLCFIIWWTDSSYLVKMVGSRVFTPETRTPVVGFNIIGYGMSSDLKKVGNKLKASPCIRNDKFIIFSNLGFTRIILAKNWKVSCRVRAWKAIFFEFGSGPGLLFNYCRVRVWSNHKSGIGLKMWNPTIFSFQALFKTFTLQRFTVQCCMLPDWKMLQ